MKKVKFLFIALFAIMVCSAVTSCSKDDDKTYIAPNARGVTMVKTSDHSLGQYGGYVERWNYVLWVSKDYVLYLEETSDAKDRLGEKYVQEENWVNLNKMEIPYYVSTYEKVRELAKESLGNIREDILDDYMKTLYYPNSDYEYFCVYRHGTDQFLFFSLTKDLIE